MNDLDVPLLTGPAMNFSIGGPNIVISKAQVLTPGEHTIGKFTFRYIDAPGHSEGCSMLLWDDHLFCGDVLFQGSIGRTDLATSSNTKMMQSLKYIKTMDPDLKVYPGHGPRTTLKDEFQWILICNFKQLLLFFFFLSLKHNFTIENEQHASRLFQFF